MTVKTTVATGASFTVPAGITKTRARARGAAAVPNYFSAAGRGAIVQSILSVAPADVLSVSAIPGGAGGAGNGTGGGNGGNGGDGVNIAGLVFAGGAGGNAGTMAPRAAGNPHGDAVGGDAGMAAGAAGSVLQTGSNEYPPVDPGSGAVGGTGGAAGASPNPGTAGKSHADGGNGGAGGNGSLGTVDPPGSFSNYKGAPGGGGGGGGYGGGGGASGSKNSGGYSAGGGGGSSLADEWVGFNTATIADAEFAVAGAPKMPTMVFPTGNVYVATSREFSFQIGHNADTPGDVLDAQSDLDIRYRLIGAGSWTTLSSLGAVQAYEITAGTLTAGDYEWQARTWSDGVVGAWAAAEYFRAAVPPATPVVTSHSAHDTINVASAVVTWTASGQIQSQAQLVGDLAGVADPTVIYSDTGVVTSATTSATLAAATNHVDAHIRVRVRTTAGGLWSDWADVAVTIVWAGPPSPDVVRALGGAAIIVTVTNPAPTGIEPAADSNEVWVTENGVEQRRAVIGTNETWTYHTPIGDVGIRVVAIYSPTQVSTSTEVLW